MSQSTDQPKRTKRTNGEGSLYLNGDRWRGAIIWTGPDGVQHRKTFAAKLQGTVKDRMAAFRADLEANAGAIPKGTTGEYLTAWLETARHDIRPATWVHRRQMVRSYIVPALGSVALSKLVPGDVERMTAGMVKAGRSPTTAAGARVVLRRALADAQRDGKVRQNAAALARPPRIVRRELEYLDAAQLRTLLDATTGHVLGPLVAVAATTGLRQGELLGLRWQDVDTVAASLTVRRSMALAWDGTYQLAEPKTKRSRRTINLPARAVAALVTQRGRQEALQAAAGTAWQDRAGLVFTTAAGIPLRSDEVTHGYQKLLKAAKLPVVSFHALRHSCATALLAAGFPLKTVSETLGHASIAITADVYAHLSPELRRDAADAMDRALR